ncbi:MAG: alpha/beta hydrolase [Gammaproteobacteria bacterium]|nr:alpha/beta hydrolase [Gammaproteobacteria bacterium]
MPKARVNGIQLYYEIHGAGEPLVFISGVGYGAAYWTSLLPNLTDKFQVIVFDNRGLGQSSMPDIPYSVEMMAADTMGLIDALELERPHLLGHSLGASIAFEIGRRRPQRLGKIIFVAGLYPGPEVAKPSEQALQVLRNREGDAADLVKRGLRIATAPGFKQKRPRRYAALMRMGLERTQPASIFLRQVNSHVAYLETDKLTDGFQPPLCLIYGREDEVTPPANGERIQAKLPRSELHLVPDAGHHFPCERPKKLLKIIKRFLSF